MLTRVECVEVNDLVIEVRERRAKKNSYVYSSTLSSDDYRELLRHGKRNGKRRHSKPTGYKRETRVEIIMLERQRQYRILPLPDLSQGFIFDEDRPSLLGLDPNI